MQLFDSQPLTHNRYHVNARPITSQVSQVTTKNFIQSTAAVLTKTHSAKRHQLGETVCARVVANAQRELLTFIEFINLQRDSQKRGKTDNT